MKKSIALMITLGVAACGAPQPQSVGPVVAQNPTLNFLEYMGTTAVQRTQKTKAVDVSGYIAIAIRIGERCEHLQFNRNSKELMRDKLNRAMLLQGGKAAVTDSLTKAEAEYKKTYGVSFAQDANGSTCAIADKEFAKQTIPTAFLWDMRMKPKT